jgi:polar amino acid transport system substrate-binding protein
VNGVLASVKNGEADIGFLAYDPVRAKEVDYSQTYALAQNTYLVLDGSPLRSISEIDRAGMRIGVTEGDTADLVLTRTLKNAELWRNKGGDMQAALRALQSREIAGYATNRQRLHDLSQMNAGLRLLPENFHGVEQSIIVRKGNTKLLEIVQNFLDEARSSGLIASAIAHSGIVGLDVAPPRDQQKRAKAD